MNTPIAHAETPDPSISIITKYDEDIIFIGDFVANVIDSRTEEIINLLVLERHDSEYWRYYLGKLKISLSRHRKSIITSKKIISVLQEEKVIPHYKTLVASGCEAARRSGGRRGFNQCIEMIRNHDVNSLFQHKDFVDYMDLLFRYVSTFISHYCDIIRQLDIFINFKNIDHSAVIIGANGSGKSSFSRQAKNIIDGNVVIISAQKFFSYNPNTSVPIGSFSHRTNVHKYQSQDKLHESKHLTLHDIILALIEEFHSTAYNYYNSNEESKRPERGSSKLEKTMEIWSRIIQHRTMSYRLPKIIVHTTFVSDYDFMLLSDGEKAIFYYIANILFAPSNAFIIVDEPETHLHVSMTVKLWDELEQLRSDCRFIYLTHDLNFASSRTSASKFWSKNYSPEYQWDITELPADDALPETLLMEILGSRQKILFCEGDNSSIDYRLYCILFPEYKVTPVGGSRNVISYTRAYNKSKDIFGSSAIGIIDLDYHHENEITQLQTESIYCLEVHEVENILCDELLIHAGIDKFHSNKNFSDIKDKLFYQLEADKEKQITKYTATVTFDILKNNFTTKASSTTELKNKFNAVIESLNIDSTERKYTELIDQIITDKNYADGIKHYNNKGLPGLLGGMIVDKYTHRILGLLRDDKELADKLRGKYFPAVPTKKL